MTDLAAPPSSAPGAGLGSIGHRLLNRLSASWRTILICLPYVWLLLFFLLPFVIVLKISLAEAMIARPPFSP